MKYYYTDPLAAAWMSENFGVQFKKTKCLFVGGYRDGSIEIIGEIPEKIFVRSDSEYIYEMQVGDLIGLVEADSYCIYYGTEAQNEYLDRSYNQGLPFVTIIRDGKQFFWPEIKK